MRKTKNSDSLLQSLEQRTITTLLFDLDGTIWDFRTNAIASLKELYVMHRLDRFYSDFLDFHKRYAPCNHALWAAYARGEVTKDFLIVERFASPLREVGVLDETLPQALSCDFFICLSEKNQLMPNAMTAIQALQPRYDLAIVSNGFPEIQYKKMDGASLRPYFSQVILSEDVGAPKPTAQFFDAALRQCGCQRSEVLLIGDEYPTDIVGSFSAGIHSIWYNPQRLETPDDKHDLEINDLDELLPLLLS